MNTYHDKARWVLHELAKGKSMSEALRTADCPAPLRQPVYMTKDGGVFRRSNAMCAIEASATLIGYVCRDGGRVWWEPAN